MTTNRPYRHFLIVRNPISSNARLADRRIAKLQLAFPHVATIIIDTLPGGRAANRKLLRPYAGKLGKESLLCIAGGDGTINLVLDILFHDELLPKKAGQTPLLPLWGGNANDLAHMLNGQARLAKLPTLIESGTVIKVFPLVCRLQKPKAKAADYVAACYVSFGASAKTTQILAEQSAQKKAAFLKFAPIRFIGELFSVILSMSRASTFKAIENDQQKTIYEYVFFNGPRFAKVSGIKRRLTDQTFHSVIVEHKRLADVLLSAAALTSRKNIRKFESTHVSFTALEDTWFQFDGEAIRMSAGSKVTVDISSEPFFALSYRNIHII